MCFSVCVCKLGEIWEALYVEAEYRGTWKNQEDVYLFIVDLPIKKKRFSWQLVCFMSFSVFYIIFCVLFCDTPGPFPPPSSMK